MKIQNILIVVLIAGLLIFVSGQEGCPQGGSGTAKSGVEYNLVEGISTLTQGKILERGETFKVGIHIDNYDSKDKQGMLCVKDNLADSFQGIPTEGEGDCQSFFVKASQTVKQSQQSSSSQVPGTTTLYFPEQGGYNYANLPPALNAPFDAKLLVSLKYRQNSQITGTVTSPDETQPVLTQDSQPIMTSIKKSVYQEGSDYKINLQLTFIKQAGYDIYSSTFSEKNKVALLVEMPPLNIQCTDLNNNPVSVIDFEEKQNEKIIKCFALTSSLTQQSYPLVITLDYGVDLKKEYGFAIKTK